MIGKYELAKKKFIEVDKNSIVVFCIMVVFIIMSFNIYSRYNKKTQIFIYFKEMQSVENHFYELMDKVLNQSLITKEEGLCYRKELKEILKESYKKGSNDFVKKNYELFLLEIECGEKIVEALLNEDYMERTNSLKRYNVIAQSRRENLKEIFDENNIPYIELNSKIIYKTK